MVEASIKVPPICQIACGNIEGRLRKLWISSICPANAVSVEAMADTGCQSYLAGFKLLEKLKLSSKDLIPVNMQMHSADNHDISILGAVIFRLSGRDQLGDERMT